MNLSIYLMLLAIWVLIPLQDRPILNSIGSILCVFVATFALRYEIKREDRK